MASRRETWAAVVRPSAASRRRVRSSSSVRGPGWVTVRGGVLCRVGGEVADLVLGQAGKAPRVGLGRGGEDEFGAGRADAGGGGDAAGQQVSDVGPVPGEDQAVDVRRAGGDGDQGRAGQLG